MSYEIPQQLEYREKVVFGLTFSQLAWAMLFGFLPEPLFPPAANQCCIIEACPSKTSK